MIQPQTTKESAIPRPLRKFLRDFVDDVIRLVTLAALFGAALSGRLDDRTTIVAATVLGLLALVMLVATSISVLEFAGEHVARPSWIFALFVFGISLLVSAGIFFVGVTAVLKALKV